MMYEKKKGRIIFEFVKDTKPSAITKVLQDPRNLKVGSKTNDIKVRVFTDPRRIVNPKNSSLQQIKLRPATKRKNRLQHVYALRKTSSRLAMRHFLGNIEKSTPKPFEEVSRNLGLKSAESMERFKSLLGAE